MIHDPVRAPCPGRRPVPVPRPTAGARARNHCAIRARARARGRARERARARARSCKARPHLIGPRGRDRSTDLYSSFVPTFQNKRSGTRWPPPDSPISDAPLHRSASRDVPPTRPSAGLPLVGGRFSLIPEGRLVPAPTVKHNPRDLTGPRLQIPYQTMSLTISGGYSVFCSISGGAGGRGRPLR